MDQTGHYNARARPAEQSGMVPSCRRGREMLLLADRASKDWSQAAVFIPHLISQSDVQ
jgi:hypothetical protein